MKKRRKRCKKRGRCPICGALDIALNKLGRLTPHAHPQRTPELCSWERHPVNGSVTKVKRSPVLPNGK